MVKENKLVKGLCGFILSALLILFGAVVIHEAGLTANASMNADLKAIEDSLVVGEANEASNTTVLNGMNYLTKDSFYVTTVTSQDHFIAKNSYASGTVSAKRNGYTPVGIAGHTISYSSTNGGLNSFCNLYRMYLSGDTVYYAIKSQHPSQQVGVSVVFYVLYIKN